MRIVVIALDGCFLQGAVHAFDLALPAAIPGLILGITLVLTFQMLGLLSGIPRIVLGHASFVMPVILMIVHGAVAAA